MVYLALTMQKVFLFTGLFLLCLQPKAQQIPLHSNYIQELNSLLSNGDSVRFTSVKPLFLQGQQQYIADTNAAFLLKPWLTEKKVFKNIKERLLNGNLLEVHKEDVHLSLNPVIAFTAGKSGEQEKYTYLSTRGVNLQGMVGSKVHFGSSFFENQARFPGYVDSAIRANGSIVPGQGFGRNYKVRGFDFARSEGYVSYTASSRFNAVLGYGKNFIGDGYRSLLLSDNSFTYPYLRLQAAFWRINYTVLYSQYSNPRYLINQTYQRKFSTIHYLNYTVSKRFQVALFESIIWQARDSTSARGFDLQYLNPVIFLRPVEFSVGSTDNALLGLNWKYQAAKKAFVYGQMVLDDINIGETLKNKKQHLNNKYGLQVGLWTKNLFKVSGLNYRFEYNTVRPFTYGHRRINQNYTHYNQALAHTLGANFHEVINNLYFTKNRWYAEVHSVIGRIGEDYNNQIFGNNLWGGEAGVPTLGSKTLDGLRTNFTFNQLTAGWTVNPAYNLKIKLQVGKRSRNNSLRRQSETFYNIGIVTNLSNYYYDF